MQLRDVPYYSTTCVITSILFRPNITVLYSMYSEVHGVHCITVHHVSDVRCFNMSVTV
jgi:hypothetical protein